jgi:hypothetical protein
MSTTPAPPLPYETDVADVEVDRMRKDFFDIWQKNAVVVTQQRRSLHEIGNYGDEDKTAVFSVDKEIRINLQGVYSQDWARKKYGIDYTDRSQKCYALYTEDLQNDDRIIFNNEIYIVDKLNGAMHHGVVIFWEFTLKYVDDNTDAWSKSAS